MSNPIPYAQIQQISLRTVEPEDLETFFCNQKDMVAVQMAAFTAEDPSDRQAFDAHWQRIMADPEVTNRTILYQGTVIGHVASFVLFGELEVTYWIDRAYWGKGLATLALGELLAKEVTARPIYGRAAKDNIGSIRVLEKCGFQYIGQDKGYANARGKEILEVIMRLDS